MSKKPPSCCAAPVSSFVFPKEKRLRRTMFHLLATSFIVMLGTSTIVFTVVVIPRIDVEHGKEFVMALGFPVMISCSPIILGVVVGKIISLLFQED